MVGSAKGSFLYGQVGMIDVCCERIAHSRSLSDLGVRSEGETKGMHSIPDHQQIQVAVIPFRVHQGQQEILLVTARKKKHWTLPKGDYIDDLSMREITRIKAFQEAGIKGNVSGSSIGVYQYFKDTTSYQVYVYVMEVHEALKYGHQKKRNRRWFPLNKAADKIKHQDLGRLIRYLPDFLLEAELREVIEHLPVFTRFKR